MLIVTQEKVDPKFLAKLDLANILRNLCKDYEGYFQSRVRMKPHET